MKRSIFLTSTVHSSFVKKDISIFKELGYSVRLHHFTKTNNLELITSTLKHLLLVPFWVARNKIVVNYFGGLHSLYPSIWGRILRKPVITILGGVDCCSFPSISYGALRSTVNRFFISNTARLSTVLAPVHTTLIERNDVYSQPENHQGLRHYFPKLRTTVHAIGNGFDPQKFVLEQTARDPYSVITIASGLNSEFRFPLKGVDLIIKAARKMPDFTFCIVGITTTIQQAPENLIQYPFIPNNELSKLLNNYNIYAQLSLSEGFPNALCEAMLCGCIPVVSDVASMPEIVGERDHVLSHRDVTALENQLRKIASDSTDEKRGDFRKSIEARYPLEKRKQEFGSLFTTLVDSNSML